MKNTITFWCCLLSFSLTNAQDGTYDSSFNDDGLLEIVFDSAHQYYVSSAIQSDGKIISVGRVGTVSNRNILLVRVNSDGTIDNTFGTNGKFYLHIKYLENFYSAQKITLQEDDKILISGYADFFNSYYYDFYVLKLNTDGSVDSSFGENGITIVDFGYRDFGRSLALNTDGSIILTGYIHDVDNQHDTRFAICKLKSNGSLDSSFGVNGKSVKDVDGNLNAFLSAILADGRILVCGNYNTGITEISNIVLLRLFPNGKVDSSFGKDGIVLSGFNSQYSNVRTMEVQKNGQILLAGHDSFPDKDAVMMRLNKDGSKDRSFGHNGVVSLTSPVGNNTINDLIVQEDNKILVSGSNMNSHNNPGFLLNRYNQNGSLDLTFGTGGVLVPDFHLYSMGAKNIHLQKDGNIILGGSGEISRQGHSIIIARIKSGLDSNQFGNPIEKNHFVINGNPLNKNSTIEFSLWKDETITIEMYDISGKLVSTILNNESVSKGSHKLPLNTPRHLAQGMYTIKISISTGFSVIKAVK